MKYTRTIILLLQVIAIEEKALGSTDYNKSPATQFKTSKDTQVGLGILVWLHL